MISKYLSFFSAWLALAAPALAHDTWLQTNTAVVRSGDAIYISLMLGNHGNEHRDFKLAGKPNLDTCNAELIGPDGATFDLKPMFIDRGYTPKEGDWSAQFEPVKPGLYLAAQTQEQVERYGPVRVIRSAKTFFLTASKLDDVPADAPGFSRVLGHSLELVPLANTVAPMGPGMPIRVRLLFKGSPLSGEKISFIPMGETLKGEFDPKYERRTDAAGAASFEPSEADYYLIVSHHVVPEQGPGYKSTNYTATLTVIVPALCPCCGD